MGVTPLLTNSQDRDFGPYSSINTLMDIKELESFNMADAVKFHKNLNPALWTEKNTLDPEVRRQLLLIAEDFVTYLGLKNLDVEDVTISGSNAAYSYTPNSDLDLHVLVDISKLPDDEVYRELFTAKKTLYNDDHDISVHGVPVELYVQDSKQPHISLGEYSLVNDKWLRIPKKQKANFDQLATKVKYEKLGNLIELAINDRDLERLNKVIDIVKRYRQTGLDEHGEFGPENLAYKALRKQGYVKLLYDLRNELRSEKLSLEDYHPNAKPRGPEFPPTMPSGTIRVDVSDVYDWYKLGQHISDLEGLGKHDFGQGPPSTILSFGDEDLEHQYIDALKKTGLDTTDIDPKGHEPLKGQKVDTRYNVKESVKFIEGTNCKNCVWWKRDSEKPVGKDELNKYGGLKPPNKEYIAMSKRVDLVTLPGKDTVKEKGFCYHKDINDWVTERMCCAKWDGEGVIRDYKGESPLMESKAEAVRKIQKYLNKKYNANLDIDGILGPLTLQSINKFMPQANKASAPEPDKTTGVQGKEVKEASGYIPSEKEMNDPRFKTALTVDVKPDSIKKNAKAFGWDISRAGNPPLLRK
jgi:hypothetical protein